MIDTDLAQADDDAFRCGELCDGTYTHHLAALVYRLHHGIVHGVLVDVHDECAVDLQVVDRQAGQTGERRQATAEIIQRE